MRGRDEFWLCHQMADSGASKGARGKPIGRICTSIENYDLMHKDIN